MEVAELSLAEAIATATTRPARLLRQPLPALAVGQPANLVVFEHEASGGNSACKLLRTCVDGRWVEANQAGGRAEPLGPDLFVDVVAAGLHAQGPIRLLRPVVLLFDVESEADHIGQGKRLGPDLLVQGAEDALAAGLGEYVDALEPPEPAVPPVAPFAGNRRLTHDRAVRSGLGHPVAKPLGGVEGGVSRPLQDGAVEGLTLGLDGRAVD